MQIGGAGARGKAGISDKRQSSPGERNMALAGLRVAKMEKNGRLGCLLGRGNDELITGAALKERTWE